VDALGRIGTPEAITAVAELAVGITAVFAALAVALLRNKVEGIGRISKTIAAAAVPLVSIGIQYALTREFNGPEMATAISGLLTAILVYFAFNYNPENVGDEVPFRVPHGR
jgi:L-lactate permease